jgi:hypothetical protein
VLIRSLRLPVRQAAFDLQRRRCGRAQGRKDASTRSYLFPADALGHLEPAWSVADDKEQVETTFIKKPALVFFGPVLRAP